MSVSRREVLSSMAVLSSLGITGLMNNKCFTVTLEEVTFNGDDAQVLAITADTREELNDAWVKLDESELESDIDSDISGVSSNPAHGIPSVDLKTRITLPHVPEHLRLNSNPMVYVYLTYMDDAMGYTIKFVESSGQVSDTLIDITDIFRSEEISVSMTTKTCVESHTV